MERFSKQEVADFVWRRIDELEDEHCFDVVADDVRELDDRSVAVKMAYAEAAALLNLSKRFALKRSAS